MRALVGQVWQETNSFNPIATTRDAFTVREAADMVDAVRGTGTIVGGIVAELDDRTVDIVPSIAATATSGGPVDHMAFVSFMEEILRAAADQRPDLVVLDLHGAMMTDRTTDCEGELLSRLRDTVGATVPIAVGLDLHAYVTETMLSAADVLVPCKNNPHSDFPDTGRLTARLGLQMAEGAIDPVMTVARVPMLLAGMTETHEGPLLDAHRALKGWLAETATALDASLCNCQPFLDAPDMGQCVIAISDGPLDSARDLVTSVATGLWARRHAFVNRFTSIRDALDRVRAEPHDRPFVLSDYGDRTNAGAPGDGTTVLAALIDAYPELRAAVPITDPEAVDRARRAGVGGTVEMAIGGKFTPSQFRPLEITAKVTGIGDGVFRQKGPLMAGEDVRNGTTALLQVGNVTVVANARPARTQDVMFYEGQGLAIGDHDVVVVKSGNHFQLSYDGVATPIKVASPGVGAYRPGQMPVKRAPVFPEIDPPDPEFLPVAYSR